MLPLSLKHSRACQAEHRVRARLIQDRTALSNEMLGMLGEFASYFP